ncbi:hypothetical protein QYE76_026219 [Lolium multiflorum]|uniref:USP domain-containing protein n=1 Tax=Lolium multiflorum TaxID=4521 RepID=A0AAD8VUX7_LOLMU|nr:hypothetical protein QYE76_026219 [Lolium multiflorum]
MRRRGRASLRNHDSRARDRSFRPETHAPLAMDRHRNRAPLAVDRRRNRAPRGRPPPESRVPQMESRARGRTASAPAISRAAGQQRPRVCQRLEPLLVAAAGAPLSPAMELEEDGPEAAGAPLSPAMELEEGGPEAAGAASRRRCCNLLSAGAGGPLSPPLELEELEEAGGGVGGLVQVHDLAVLAVEDLQVAVINGEPVQKMDKRTREVLLPQVNKKRKINNKMRLQYDDPLVLLNDYMKEQIDGGELWKLVSKRKKVPLSAKGVWRYNRMRQEDIFSKPLIHMRLGFPRMTIHCDKMLEQDRGKDAIIDLNLSPSHQMLEQHRVNKVVIDLNLSPSHQMQVHERGKNVVIDLNLSPSQQMQVHDRGKGDIMMLEKDRGKGDEMMQVHDRGKGDDMMLEKDKGKGDETMLEKDRGKGDETMLEKDRCKGDDMMLEKDRGKGDETMLEKDRGKGDETMLEKDRGKGDETMLEKDRGKGDETMLEKDRGRELRDEERYGIYFALEVIRRRDGGFTKEDKQLIAEMHQGLKYDLYGVVKHSGLPNFGHYMCTIRSSPTSWHLMNDSLVDSITETSALNQQAYLLFYVRQGMFPWFSSFLQEANSSAHSATKRMYPVNNDHNVFAFDSLGLHLLMKGNHMNDNHLLVRKGASPAASSCGCGRQQLGEAAAAAPDSSLGRSLGWH